MRKKTMKNIIKKGIQEFSEGMEMFDGLKLEEIKFAEMDQKKIGYCMVRDIPILFELHIKGSKVIELNFNFDLKRYYENTHGDNSDEVKKIKRILIQNKKRDK